jgi:hypothetical protein
MRSRAAHFACLLLLLSSLAVTNARASGEAPSRTPGGVFVRNLLLRAVVEEAEPGLTSFGREESAAFTVENAPVPSRTFRMSGPVAQAAHVHAVTGSSL